MEKQLCSYSATLEELLKQPMDSMVLIGADDDDESETDEDEESEETGDDDDESDESGDSDKKSKKGKDDKDEKSKKSEDPKDRQIANLEEERERNVTRRKTAQKRVLELEAEVAQLKKSGTTDDAAKQHYSEIEKTNESLSAANSNLAIKVAFLSENTYSWVDPKAALRLADFDDVEIDKKGKVEGLSAALDRLAKDSPWLLKPNDDEKDDDDKNDKKGNARSGDQPRNKPGSAASVKAREAKLRSKYPGLRR